MSPASTIPKVRPVAFAQDQTSAAPQVMAESSEATPKAFPPNINTAVMPPGSIPLPPCNCIDWQIVSIKSLRRDIDVEIQRVKSLTPSSELALVITKLQEAVMWLGMDLKRINEESPGASPNPYPNSKDPSNTKIEPTADGLKL